MLTTTEFRSHWIDSAGRAYAQHHPFVYEGQLTPVLNLDEVSAWLALSTSNEMRSIGFPGGDNDARVFYARQFLRPDQHQDERERLAPLICEELTDEVPRYSHARDDWRTPFVQMRERWPLPALGGPAEIWNLTPHAVVVGEHRIEPDGVVARAVEESTPAEPIRVSIPDPTGAPADRIEYAVPTSTTRYTGLVDLPAPQPGVYLVVSMVIPPVAFAHGRWTGDLLVPGEQVRDAANRIIGCRSLARPRV